MNSQRPQNGKQALVIGLLITVIGGLLLSATIGTYNMAVKLAKLETTMTHFQGSMSRRIDDLQIEVQSLRERMREAEANNFGNQQEDK